MPTRSPSPSSKRAAPDAIESAIVSIRRLVRVLRVNAQRTQSTAGISAAQLFVLEQLGDGTGLSLNALAARTLTDRSSVADAVDRLVAQRLVDRTVDPADRRRAAVRITVAGRRMLARAPEAPTTTLLAAIRALSTREQTALARSLAQLNHALGASDEPATMLFVDDTAVAPVEKHRRTPRRDHR